MHFKHPIHKSVTLSTYNIFTLLGSGKGLFVSRDLYGLSHDQMAVSYTHLTLPTNREV